LAGSSTVTTYWICDKGHHFDAITDQVTRKRNKTISCPLCRGLRVDEQNSLATFYPSIANEWVKCIDDDSLTPNDVTPGCSSKQVLWKCSKGHEWETTPKHRTKGETGCPACRIGNRISKQSYILYFYLKKYFNDVTIEAPLERTRYILDIDIPSCGVIIEYDGGYYHKRERDIKKDLALLEKRPGDTIIRIRDPECSVYESPNPNIIFYFLETQTEQELQFCIENILQDQFHLKEQVDIAQDNTAILELMDRTETKNSLASFRPDLVQEWDYEANGNLKPDFFKPFAHEKVHWICSKGHQWSASIASRTSVGNNCPICGNRKLYKDNNLAAVNPELAKEWHPSNKKRPQKYFPNSHFKVWWLCPSCDHEWSASIDNRNGNGSGCPKCHHSHYK